MAHRLQACDGIAPLDPAREAALRAAVIEQARSWVGTPYRQLGATKGIGVDCCMLLIRVLADAGVMQPFDPRPYPPTWFFHRDDERYLEWIEASAHSVASGQPGDIITFKFGRAFSHSGFLIDAAHVCHAFADEGAVTISPLHTVSLAQVSATKRREQRCYDYFAPLRG